MIVGGSQRWGALMQVGWTAVHVGSGIGSGSVKGCVRHAVMARASATRWKRWGLASAFIEGPCSDVGMIPPCAAARWYGERLVLPVLHASRRGIRVGLRR